MFRYFLINATRLSIFYNSRRKKIKTNVSLTLVCIQRGAILIDDLEIANISSILDFSQNGDLAVSPAEFKLSQNEYLPQLLISLIRFLLDIIDFNNKHIVEVIN